MDEDSDEDYEEIAANVISKKDKDIPLPQILDVSNYQYVVVKNPKFDEKNKS